MDMESEHIKEVYAHYGLAMYEAQCVERQLAILLATEYGPAFQSMTRDCYDELLKSLFKKTFGGLLHKLEKSIGIPDGFEQRLRNALKKRNWLAHHYFWERAGHFMTERGRNSMIEELRTVTEKLHELDQELIEVSKRWMEKVGLPEEIVELEKERLIHEATDNGGEST